MILPVPPQLGQLLAPTRPVPLHSRHGASPVPVVPGGAWPPCLGWVSPPFGSCSSDGSGITLLRFSMLLTDAGCEGSSAPSDRSGAPQDLDAGDISKRGYARSP